MSGDTGREASPGIPVGRFLGVPIYANVSLFVTAGLLALAFLPALDGYDLGSARYLVAAAFALLLYLSILVHEVAHAVAALGYGLPVRSITLYMLGGATALGRRPGSPGREFVISFAGPLATLLIALLAWGGLALTTPGTVVHLLLLQLTFANVFVGVYNLLPGLPLDGGSMLAAAVWQVTGRELTGTVVAAWSGRLLAILTGLAPFLWSAAAGTEPDIVLIVWALIVAMFLWTGSTQSLAGARVRARLPSLSVRGLIRPALAVRADLPLAEALRQLGEVGARAIVVVDSDDRPTGIVNEAAVTATPVARRPWVATGDLARRVEPDLVLRSDLSGEGLLEALQRSPASEYLVVSPTGSLDGVLSAADVQRAFTAA